MIRYVLLFSFIRLVWAQELTIAVLDFDGKGVSQSDADNLTDRLRNELFKTGAYVVLERSQMEEVLKEQGLQQAGICETECAVEVGKLLGVKQMVAGSIGKVGNVYTVSARIFDVQTGQILQSADFDHIGNIGQLLLKGMKEVVSQLTDNQSSIVDDAELSEALNQNNSIKMLTVDEIKICKDVKNRRPIDSNDMFLNNIGTLYCFTRIKNSGSKMEVNHRWYHKDIFMAVVRYDVPTNSKGYNSWTKRNILPSQSGKWRVDITDKAGIILKTITFNIL